VDCANGAAYKVAPAVLRELGAEVITLGDEPNGTNINLNCGSLYPDLLRRKVVEAGADLGVAHDGDADRAIFVSEKGAVVDGDRILAAMALSLAREGRLKKNTLVTTIMSNGGLELALRPANIGVIRTPVGDRYVLEQMLKEGCNLGGEPSGHIIFLDHNTTGDGLITALQVMSLMNRSGKRLSELTDCMTPLPQILLNVRVAEKREIPKISGLAESIARAERRLDGIGRVLVRYSGTEALLRIMVEGDDEEKIRRMAEELATLVEKEIGKHDGERS
jgi:phosphoglucosamine mutase